MPVKWTPDKDQMLLLKILETHELAVDTKKISQAWRKLSRTYPKLLPEVSSRAFLTLQLAEDQGEVPTARAIQERLVKIRQNSRANGAQHFGISSGSAKNPSSKPATPRKPASPKTPGGNAFKTSNRGANGIASPASSSTNAKRKQTDMNGKNPVEIDLTSDDEGTPFQQRLSAKLASVSRNTTLSDHANCNSQCDRDAPSESMRQLSVTPSVIKNEEQDIEDSGESPTKRARTIPAAQVETEDEEEHTV